MNLKSPSTARVNASTLSKHDLQALKDSVKGQVIIKGEASKEDYEAAIKRWNEVYIAEAHVIVLVDDEDDVKACVDFVRKHHLDVAVVGGRHSHHGASSSTSFVIDQKNRRKVTVDKINKTVTAQGGCLARDVEEPAEAEGLSVVFGAVNDTGIGGLTLGGGSGWLTGQYGMAVDNLLSARVVIANGEIFNASERENQDLFWAIRGGGPNFGIVTEFTYRAYEQGPVFMWTMIFPENKLQASVSLINKLHTDAVIPANGKLQLMFAMIAPPGSLKLCPGWIVFYDGPEDQARTLAKPIFDLGPIMTMGGMMPYSQVTVHAPGIDPPGFNRYAASSTHMDHPLNKELLLNIFKRTQSIIDKHGESAAACKCILDVRDYRKVASVPGSAMAYAGRHNTAFVTSMSQWADPKLDLVMREEVVGIQP